MRIINLEDDVTKHVAIERVLNKCGISSDNISWVKSVADGIEEIMDAISDGNPFDLAITDMHYPLVSGNQPDWEAGECFIKKIKNKNLDLPIIVCSSINEKIPDILGNVWYSEVRDWEAELANLVAEIR